MNILILRDIVGPSGRKALIKTLPNLIKKKKLDFVIVNGENAANHNFLVCQTGPLHQKLLHNQSLHKSMLK